MYVGISVLAKRSQEGSLAPSTQKSCYCRQSRHSNPTPLYRRCVVFSGKGLEIPVTDVTGISDAKEEKLEQPIVDVGCKCCPECVRTISSFPMWLDDELDSSKT